MVRIPTFILAVVMASALVMGLRHDTASGGHGVQLSTAAQPVEGTEPTVTVFGEGSVLVKPDVAWLNIGVEMSGPTASETAQENQRQMNQGSGCDPKARRYAASRATFQTLAKHEHHVVARREIEQQSSGEKDCEVGPGDQHKTSRSM